MKIFIELRPIKEIYYLIKMYDIRTKKENL